MEGRCLDAGFCDVGTNANCPAGHTCVGYDGCRDLTHCVPNYCDPAVACAARRECREGQCLVRCDTNGRCPIGPGMRGRRAAMRGGLPVPGRVSSGDRELQERNVRRHSKDDAAHRAICYLLVNTDGFLKCRQFLSNRLSSTTARPTSCRRRHRKLSRTRRFLLFQTPPNLLLQGKRLSTQRQALPVKTLQQVENPVKHHKQ